MDSTRVGGGPGQCGADAAEAGERPDLTAWRRRQALRSGNAAQPVRNKRRYRRAVKHRARESDR